MNVTAKPAITVEMGASPGQSWLVTPDAVDMTRPCAAGAAARRSPRNRRTSQLTPPRPRLLIVDMQNDFCAKGGWLHMPRHRHLPEPQADQTACVADRGLPRQRVPVDLGQLGRAQGSA